MVTEGRTLVFLILLLSHCNQVFSTVKLANRSAEYRLKQTLLDGYDPEVRPVLVDSDKVLLKFEIALQQLVEVNEKGESLTLSVYLRQRWNDPALKWNTSEYNVSSVMVSPSNIWLPDLTLFNNVERENIAGNLDQVTNRVIIYNNGNTKWLAPAILSSKCKMNVRDFPFDTQHCKLVIGSWTFHGFKLDITPSSDNVDIGSFNKHSEWELVSAVHKKNVQYYGCCVEPYPDITVEIVLKRRPLFYVLNLILPMILIGVLTLLAFFLPAASGERLSFAVTLLLALTVFMLIVAELIPASSETIPLLGIFFTAVLVEMVLMIFTLCFTLKLHLKIPTVDEELHPWLKQIVYEKLAFLVRIRTPQSSEIYECSVNEDKAAGKESGVVENGIHTPLKTPTTDNLRNRKKPDPLHQKETMSSLMQKNLEVMTDKYKIEEKERNLKYQYEVCAMTIDTVALYFYLFMFVIITLTYIFSNPL